MNESGDILRTTGLLTLGSRFRRLGERLQSETHAILSGFDARVATPWHPLLNLLDRRGALSVGEISRALGLAQPGITRSVAGLAELGLVAVGRSDTDARVTLARLTPEGRDFVARARDEVWPRVERAVADLCDGFGTDLLDHLQTIEDRLDEQPLSLRTGKDTP